MTETESEKNDELYHQSGKSSDEHLSNVSSLTNTLQILRETIEKVIVGKKEAVEHAIVTLFAGGHLLIEDVPGVAKTMLARSLAKSIDADFRRIQCTPDLMPSDITGVSVFNQKNLEFEFHPGPVFSNILLADEINRTSPKTQSALLEAMAEGQVTVEEESHNLSDLFFVVATQNPVEQHGTYPLPVAQLDRFMMKIKIGYPEREDEVEIMEDQQIEHPLKSIESVMSKEEVLEARKMIRNVYIHPNVRGYIADIVGKTREENDLEVGASPRGSLHLMRAAQVREVLLGNSFVRPDTVKELAPTVLSHRVIMSPETMASELDSEVVIDRILGDVSVPVDYEKT